MLGGWGGNHGPGGKQWQPTAGFMVSITCGLTAEYRDRLRYIRLLGLAVWCSGNALVSINAVALHQARLVLGWVTAFG